MDVDMRPFLESHHKLTPANALAAVLLTEDGRYVMQLRDCIPQIFFPGHWSCFGGAIEEGETEEQALLRELHEEIDVVAEPGAATFFTRSTFDFNFAGHGTILRTFYELTINEEQYQNIQLGEGAGFDAFTADELLQLPYVAPYDRFALWMHANKSRL